MSYYLPDADAARIGVALIQARKFLDAPSRSPRANKARALLDQLLEDDRVLAFMDSIDPAHLLELE